MIVIGILPRFLYLKFYLSYALLLQTNLLFFLNLTYSNRLLEQVFYVSQISLFI